jgi:hypothetical protein
VGKPYQLFSRVSDPGILESPVVDEDGTLRLTLTNRLSPSPEHEVLCWTQNGIQRTPGDQITIEDGVWVCSAEEITLPFVVGIAFRGRRLASHLEGSLPELIQDLPHEKMGTTGALLRWFHLPLRSKENREILHCLLNKHGGALVHSWIYDSHLPGGLSQTTATTSWRCLVRYFVASWRPNAKAVRELLGLDLDAPIPSDSWFLEQVSLLCETSPILLFWCFVRWSMILNKETPGRLTGRQLANLMRSQIAGLEPEAEDAEIDAEALRLAHAAAASIKVDPRSLTDILTPAISNAVLNASQALNSRQRQNLQIALQVTTFRQYLAIVLLAPSFWGGNKKKKRRRP